MKQSIGASNQVSDVCISSSGEAVLLHFRDIAFESEIDCFGLVCLLHRDYEYFGIGQTKHKAGDPHSFCEGSVFAFSFLFHALRKTLSRKNESRSLL